MKNYIVEHRSHVYFVIYNLIKSNGGSISDETLIKLIIDILGQYQYANRGNSSNRLTDRTKGVMELVPRGFAPKKYLDYGCGSGVITKTIGARLNLPARNIYGVDITACYNTDITFLQGKTSCLADESIDLVTAFVSLHHVESASAVIKEIYRLCSRGGIFIIREHNFTGDKYLRVYLTLIHVFIEIQSNGSCDIEHLSAGINYKSITAWQNIICRYGFKCKKIKSYWGNNPQKLFYACFIKQ